MAEITKVTKEEFVATVAEKLEGTKKAAGEAYNAVFGTLEEILAVGGKGHTVSGLATFTSVIKPEYEGINNLTGEKQTFAARLKAKAKFSTGLGK